MQKSSLQSLLNMPWRLFGLLNNLTELSNSLIADTFGLCMLKPLQKMWHLLSNILSAWVSYWARSPSKRRGRHLSTFSHQLLRLWWDSQKVHIFSLFFLKSSSLFCVKSALLVGFRKLVVPWLLGRFLPKKQSCQKALFSWGSRPGKTAQDETANTVCT